MAQITDKVISKVYEGKVLEGKGQFFNFYLQGGQKKYGYFVGKGKTAPSEGMKIAMMEYETKQEGEYENNKVTKLVWMGAGTPTVSAKTPEAGKMDKNNPLWFCMSYAKDIQVARIHTGQSDLNFALEDHCLEVAKCAIDMLRFVEHPIEMAKDLGIETEKPKDPIEKALTEVDDSAIPF
jgi:hypothetical protein